MLSSVFILFKAVVMGWHLRGAGGAHAPLLSSPGGSFRPERGIESGGLQREAVDFRLPRTSSSSRRCGGRVHSPEAVMRAPHRLGWQGCTRANNFATSSRWRMRAAPVMLRLRGNALPRRHPVSRLAKQSLHLPARCPSSPPAALHFCPACYTRRFSFSRRFTRSIHTL